MAKLTTGVVRLSYANIAQPRKNDDGKAKYSSQIIIDLNVRLKNSKRIQKQSLR